jgi:hypothetical protein
VVYDEIPVLSMDKKRTFNNAIMEIVTKILDKIFPIYKIIYEIYNN